jgi:hypothetical protein
MYWSTPNIDQALEDGADVFQDPQGLVYRLDLFGILVNHTVLSETLIQFVIPADSVAERTLRVVNPDQQQGSILWNHLKPPQLDQVSPNQGPDRLNQWVILTGQNLRRPGAVWFDQRVSSEVDVNDEGTLA